MHDIWLPATFTKHVLRMSKITGSPAAKNRPALQVLNLHVRDSGRQVTAVATDSHILSAVTITTEGGDVPDVNLQVDLTKWKYAQSLVKWDLHQLIWEVNDHGVSVALLNDTDIKPYDPGTAPQFARLIVDTHPDRRPQESDGEETYMLSPDKVQRLLYTAPQDVPFRLFAHNNAVGKPVVYTTGSAALGLSWLGLIMPVRGDGNGVGAMGEVIDRVIAGLENA